MKSSRSSMLDLVAWLHLEREKRRLSDWKEILIQHVIFVIHRFISSVQLEYLVPFILKDDFLNQVEEEVLISVIAEVKPVNFQDSVLVNFNLEKNMALPWNNMDASPTSGITRDNFITATGMPLKMEISPAGNWSGQNDYGMVTGDNSGIYPDSIMKTSWYVENNTGIIRLKNLDPAFEYSFTLFGSRSGSGNRVILYILKEDTLILNALQNTSNTVKFPGIKPFKTGTIDILVQKHQDASYGYLNAMVW